MKNLDPGKSNGHDEISVKKMHVLCDPTICKLLTVLFENCLDIFLMFGEKVILLQSKKGDEQLRIQ